MVNYQLLEPEMRDIVLSDTPIGYGALLSVKGSSVPHELYIMLAISGPDREVLHVTFCEHEQRYHIIRDDRRNIPVVHGIPVKLKTFVLVASDPDDIGI